GISFDFKLKEGPSRTRNAIALLKVLNYPKSIVEQAQKESLLFDEQRQWYPFD
ncbi:DNA mismatch repair protein MutS, partial [Enterococcus faecium]|nr:DNA mismatch repair protein MutS [Enterococcus faecium]